MKQVVEIKSEEKVGFKMEELTLIMPYHHNGKMFHELTLRKIIGFVDVLDGDRNVIYSGCTVDAIKFIHELIENSL